VSEFRDWQAVAQWAAPLFDVNQPPPAEIKSKVEGWLKQFDKP
jgi:hypothetical protein